MVMPAPRIAAGLAAWVSTLCIAAGLSYLIAKEEPVGLLTGTVVMKENGRPVSEARITLQGAANGAYRTVETDEEGRFQCAHLPTGEYSLEAAGKVHGLPNPRHVEIFEGQHATEFLKLERRPHSLNISLAHTVYLPGEKVKVQVTGFIPDNAVKFDLRRLDLDHFRGAIVDWPLSDEGWSRASTIDREESQSLKKSPEGTFDWKTTLSIDKPGVYRLHVADGKICDARTFSVTRLGLIAKADATQIIVCSVDLKTGEPLSGASVWLANRPNTSPSQRSVQGPGVTDSIGICRFSQTSDTGSDLLLMGHMGESVALMTGYLYGRGREENVRSYIYTDRPVYRPGQSVHYKGIVRLLQRSGNSEAESNTAFTVPARQQVVVTVRDPKQHLVNSQSLQTSEFGSFNGECELSTEAMPGYYSVEATMGDRHLSGEFEVAEYRKPEYEVKVETDKKRYVRGEPIHAKIAAAYYFGAPVQKAQVEWTVYANERYNATDEESQFSSLYAEMERESYGYGEVVAQGKSVTDDQGHCAWVIPTNGKTLPDADLNFSLSVTVTDASRKPATGEGSTLVTRGDFNLRLSTDQWVYPPNQNVKTEIVAKNYDDQAVPDLAVKVQCFKEVGPRERRLWTTGATTNSDGKAIVEFPAPGNGNYLLRVEARDSGRRKIDVEATMWVASQSFFEPEYRYPDLGIVLDKKVYQENDTARLLINTTAADSTALLTVEGTKTFEWKPVKLKKGANLLTLRVRPEWVPNVFISLTLQSGKHSVTRDAPMKVSPKEHVLKVEVSSEAQTYHPRDKARFSIRTLDAHGKPVRAEVSLGVVDESIYAIRADHPEEIVSQFYEIRSNQVETFTSFPEVQLGGDGKEAGPPVRKHFPDTALWLPSIVTDGEGRATAEMIVPDTLGAWRATAKAHTLATEVGAAIHKLTCRKDLMVQLEGPCFFTQEDATTLSAVVHNETDVAQKVKVSIKVEGLTLADAKPQIVEIPPHALQRTDWQVTAKEARKTMVTVTAVAKSGLGDAMQLTLPTLAHGIEETSYLGGAVEGSVGKEINVPATASLPTAELKLTLTPTLLSSLSGSLKYLAGYPYGCIEQTMSRFIPDIIVQRALKQFGIHNEPLEKELPKMVRDGLTRTYSMQREDGGWGWTEYISSEPWMTAYVVYGLTRAKEAGVDVEPSVIDRGRACLKRLLAENNWPDEIAYGYFILARTGSHASACFQEQRLFLKQNFKKLSNWGLACYVLGLCEQGRSSEAEPLLVKLKDQGVQTGRAIHWPFRNAALGATSVSEWPSYASYHSDVETTAMVMQALLRTQPNDSTLQGVAHWFLIQRQQDHWISTRDTATTIDALLNYATVTKELTPDYSVSVRLNGKEIFSDRFGLEDLGKSDITTTLRSPDLRHGNNRLEIVKSGKGMLYYSALMRFLLTREDLPAGSNGITLERRIEKVAMHRNEKTHLPELTGVGVVSACHSGDLLRMIVRLRANKTCEYALVECPLPAGCEVMERRPSEEDEWRSWWSDIVVRDAKVSFLLRNLDAGEHTLSVLLRAEVPGSFHVMPVTASCMYLPEISGRSSEIRLKVAK